MTGFDLAREAGFFFMSLCSNSKFIQFHPNLAFIMEGELSLAIALTTISHVYSWPGGKKIEGEKWIWNTYEDWQKDWFPYWSIRNIQNVMHKLEAAGFIKTCQPDGRMSRKKYYRVTEMARRLLTEGKIEDMRPALEARRDREESSGSHQELSSGSEQEGSSASITDNTSDNTTERDTPLPPKGGKSPLQLRTEAIFNRRPSTPLTVAEQRAFSKNKEAITATTEDEWRFLERFYAKPQSETYSRKSLAALLNNWNGEIDRAKAYFFVSKSANEPTLKFV
jgi:DNA-binding PadR family transcriptional regulator